MIFGKIEDLYLYRGLSENLAKGIDFLLNFDTTQPDGKYEVDGENIYALVSTGHTKPAEKPVYEAHRKYIDLQYIVKGEEDTGFVPLPFPFCQLFQIHGCKLKPYPVCSLYKTCI